MERQSKNAHKDKSDLKSDTISHLKQEGYSTNDIKKIQIVNMGQHKAVFAAVVTFKDEPSVDYLYRYKKSTKKIIQFDYENKGNNKSVKHIE